MPRPTNTFKANSQQLANIIYAICVYLCASVVKWCFGVGWLRRWADVK